MKEIDFKLKNVYEEDVTDRIEFGQILTTFNKTKWPPISFRLLFLLSNQMSSQILKQNVA